MRALGGAVLLRVRTEHAPPEHGGVGLTLKVDGLAQEAVDFRVHVLACLLGADDRRLRVVGLHPELQRGQAAGETVGDAEQAHQTDVPALAGRG